MKTSTKFITTALTGVTLAASLASPAYAWHPQGTIIKQVTNVTAGSAMSDANNAASAVAAKPGDLLKYTVTISNPADKANNHDNDLAFVKMTDSLPAGVELTSDASKRQISEDLGTIAPGKSTTKEYIVKVTATTDGVIENKACFTGDSIVKDAPRNGCDTANVKVTVPPAPVTPPAPAAPVTPPAPTPPAGTGAVQTPTELPKTGPADIAVIGGLAVAFGYAANLLRLKRQQA